MIQSQVFTHSRDHPRIAGKHVQTMSNQSQMVFPKCIQRKLKEEIAENLVV